MARDPQPSQVPGLLRDRLVRLVLVLAAIALVLLIFELLYGLIARFAHVLLLFLLAWLLTLVLNPAVTWLAARLAAGPAPGGAAKAPDPAARRPLAAALVYVGIALAFVVALIYFVPPLLVQLDQLRQLLPGYAAEAPRWLEALQRWAEPWGLAPALAGALDPVTLTAWLRDVGMGFALNALSLASQLATLTFDLTVVLTLSFYMVVDGQRLVAQSIDLLRPEWQPEGRLFARTMGVKFGGFIRTQLIQSALFGVVVLVLMLAFGLRYSLVVTLLVSLFMLIPVIGGTLAIWPPVIVAVFANPLLALALYAVLWVYQLVLYNGIMPRLTSEVIGLHPLLAFAALLAGGTAGGAWGALFSVPIAAVIAALAQFFRERKAL